MQRIVERKREFSNMLGHSFETSHHIFLKGELYLLPISERIGIVDFRAINPENLLGFNWYGSHFRLALKANGYTIRWSDSAVGSNEMIQIVPIQ